jgi:hypothetical protein
MDTTENIARSSGLKRETNTAGVAFLQTELDVTLTFVRLALEAGADPKRTTQHQANARKGYDVLLHLSQRFFPTDLTAVDQRQFARKLRELKVALKRLGEMLLRDPVSRMAPGNRGGEPEIVSLEFSGRRNCNPAHDGLRPVEA